MTDTTPVERVASALQQAGFRRMDSPQQISGLSFEAPAVFVGKPPLPDLVVVGDTLHQTSLDLQRMVEGIGRALDIVRSRRPLTLVIVGPRPDSTAITVLSRSARVLIVGETADETSLANWLAVLLPLHLPQPVESRDIDILEELKISADPLMLELIALAPSGTSAVTERFISIVEELFLEPDISGEEISE